MEMKTAEVELTAENQALALKLIDRANRLGDELLLLQSIIKAGGHSDRVKNLYHDELDVVRDYREITLERIALATLGDRSEPTDVEKAAITAASLGALEEE